MTNVKQMLSALAEEQVISPLDGSRMEVGPALSIETTDAGGPPSPHANRRSTRLTALFVAEFSGEIPDIGVAGLVQIFMTIDGVKFGPIFPVRVGDGAPRANFSFLAFKDDIEPGPHIVSVKLHTLRPPPVFVGIRTLTVWETVVDPASSAVATAAP